MKIIENNKDIIKALCKTHHVTTLFVFGSILTHHFNSESDIDFVVDFDTSKIKDYASNYFDFKFSLEAILKRNIDLLEEKALKNPYLKQSIDSSKQLIYG
jgi:hypothetical protein